MTPKTPKCPHCGSVIYSRRNVLCGACGKQLPPELLFTPAERKKVERDLANIKQREKAERARQETEEADAANNQAWQRVSKHHPILGAAIRAITDDKSSG